MATAGVPAESCTISETFSPGIPGMTCAGFPGPRRSSRDRFPTIHPFPACVVPAAESPVVTVTSNVRPDRSCAADGDAANAPARKNAATTGRPAPSPFTVTSYVKSQIRPHGADEYRELRDNCQRHPGVTFDVTSQSSLGTEPNLLFAARKACRGGAVRKSPAAEWKAGRAAASEVRRTPTWRVS